MNYRIIYSNDNKTILSIIDNDLSKIRSNDSLYTTNNLDDAKIYFESLLFDCSAIEEYKQTNKNKQIKTNKSYLLLNNNDYYIQNFSNKNYTNIFNNNYMQYNNIVDYNNILVYSDASIKIINTGLYSIDSKINIRNIKGNKNIDYALFINNNIINNTKKSIKLNSSNIINSTSFKHEVYLNTDDILTFKIRNITNTLSIDIIKTNISIKEL